MSHLPGSMDLVRQRTYAGMGQHFATLDQALPGVSDEHVHIDAPVFGRQAFKDLAVAQGKLQRTEAGSKRRAKAPMVRRAAARPGRRPMQDLTAAPRDRPDRPRPPGWGPDPEPEGDGSPEEGLPVRALRGRRRLRAARAGPHPPGRQARLRRRSKPPSDTDTLR